MFDNLLSNDVLDIRWIDSRRKVQVNGEAFKKDASSSSRFTFTYNGLMIKLDTTRNSGQNLAELLMWPLIEEEDLEFFAPLVGCGSTPEGELWVAQEKIYSDEVPADPVDYGVLLEKMYYMMRPVLDKYGIWDLCMTDLAGFGNWAMVKGVPKIYDWGLNRIWDTHHCWHEVPQLFSWMRR